LHGTIKSTNIGWPTDHWGAALNNRNPAMNQAKRLVHSQSSNHYSTLAGGLRRRIWARATLVVAFMHAFVTVTPTYAQIVADSNAPGNQKPTVLQTANGLPQVNIQTPSAAGVSRNQYKQFDVNRKGAILNNSRKNVQTQTGGWVTANPWLATGEARVILNEVNSSNPSQLGAASNVKGAPGYSPDNEDEQTGAIWGGVGTAAVGTAFGVRGFRGVATKGGTGAGTIQVGNALEIVPTKYRGAVSRSFHNDPELVELTEPMVVYRHWGGKALEVGSPWFLPKPYTKPGNAQRYLALPEGNTSQNLTRFEIPAGTGAARKGRFSSGRNWLWWKCDRRRYSNLPTQS